MIKIKWYDKWVYLVLWAFLFYTVAVYGLIKTNLISKNNKIGITFSIIGFLFLLSYLVQDNRNKNSLDIDKKYMNEYNMEKDPKIKIIICDSIIKNTYSEETKTHFSKLRDSLYYKTHIFVLNKENFYERSKYYTAYSNIINFNTKTVEYRKDFVYTELYVYKEVIRKSIKYFTEFPELNEINIIIYSKEEGNKYIANIKRQQIENLLNINWTDLRYGKPSSGDFGYSIENHVFKNIFNKQKISYKTYNLYL